jgi:glycosyltransferase involved in cell wall biosynthesis
MAETPQLTIGMPVRNGADGVRRALDSLLAQTWTDFRLVISDNQSTDDTVAICEAYAAADPRVTVVRQPQNLGIFGNFRYLLMQADSPYFMWACHDDFWAPTYVERNIANLAAHPEAIASCSRIEMLMPEGTIQPSRGTRSLTGTARERVFEFLKDPSDASRFYSVFRTPALKRAFPADIDVFGYDWVVLAFSLLEGDHLEVPEMLMSREAHPADHYQRAIVRSMPRAIDRWKPLAGLTDALRRGLPPEIWRACRARVLRQNLIQTLGYAKYRFPVVAPVVAAIASTEKAIAPWKRGMAEPPPLGF